MMHQRLRQARIEAGVTLAAMGRQLQVSPQQILKYERGTNRLAADRLPVWAEACGVSVASLLGHEAAMSAEGEDVIRRLLSAFRRISDPTVQNSLVETAVALAAAERRQRRRPLLAAA